MVGTWIGKTWIPPRPWRYFDAVELRDMYQDKRVLWIGDSTGRRAFATMYGILNASSTIPSTTSTTSSSSSSSSSSDNSNNSDDDYDQLQLLHVSTSAIDKPSVIDVNRGQQVEFCTKWNHVIVNNNSNNNNNSDTNTTTPLLHLHDLHPQICRPAPGAAAVRGNAGEFSFIKANCFNELERILQSELAGTTNMTADVDVIIVSMGIWEILKVQTCNQLDMVYGAVANGIEERRRQPRNPNTRLANVLDVAARFAATTGIKLVWRTSGYAKPETVAPVNLLNIRTMNIMDDLVVVNNNTNSNLMYVNWGKAMQPRSFGPDALAGDIHAHYAMEARLVLVQMITNRLVDDGFFASSSFSS
jgi:hypothetical protein